MRPGMVVYNGFWNQNGIPDPVRRLVEAGKKRGMPLTPMPNTALFARIQTSAQVDGASEFAYALFWDKDVRLARTLERSGVRVFNSPESIAVCDDKSATHLALSGRGIPMPLTLVAPMTYTEVTAPMMPFLRHGEELLGYPMVVKECFGSLGGQVYLARCREELEKLAFGMGPKPFLLQQFVSRVPGEDVRLYVVDGKVEAAIRRHSDSDFRANIGQGAHAVAYQPTEREAELALLCCQELGLLFGGVDLLHDNDGSPLVCEVNSNAHMAGIIHSTGVDIADKILAAVAARLK